MQTAHRSSYTRLPTQTHQGRGHSGEYTLLATMSYKGALLDRNGLRFIPVPSRKLEGIIQN